MSSASSVDELAARFLARAIPRAEWTHRAHLLVGAWHVHRYGPEEALARLRVGIRQLNESNGVVNSATDGYHETARAGRAYRRLPDRRQGRAVPLLLARAVAVRAVSRRLDRAGSRAAAPDATPRRRGHVLGRTPQTDRSRRGSNFLQVIVGRDF
jgi:hypothetical protein